MNKLQLSVILSIIFIFTLFAGEKNIVIPKYNQVSVYKNMPRLLNEVPVFKVNVSDHLKILDNNECCFFVTDTKGRNGWIEKKLCSTAFIGRTIKFEAASVEGINDLFSPPVIFGANDAEVLELRLSRSFRENLKDNVDREEISRIADKTVE